MSRFPPLEQLRAERDRLEADITAPVRSELAWANARVRALRNDLEALQAIMTRGLGERVLDAVRREAAHEFAPILMKALQGGPSGRQSVEVAADDLRFLMPDQVQATLMKKAREKIDELATANARHAREGASYLVVIAVPSLTIEVPVCDGVSRSPR